MSGVIARGRRAEGGGRRIEDGGKRSDHEDWIKGRPNGSPVHREAGVKSPKSELRG